MISIELTSSQKEILTALTDLYRQTEGTVRGEAIADEIDRNPGTIRNQMQSLKSLQLVEGVPGPKGGYKPTPDAYEALDIVEMDEPAAVPLRYNDERVENGTIVGIDLSSVYHPNRCRAVVQLQGPIDAFQTGEKITVGPTPQSDLQISGTIDSTDETDSTLVLDVDEMIAPAEELGQ